MNRCRAVIRHRNVLCEGMMLLLLTVALPAFAQEKGGKEAASPSPVASATVGGQGSGNLQQQVPAKQTIGNRQQESQTPDASASPTATTTPDAGRQKLEDSTPTPREAGDSPRNSPSEQTQNPASDVRPTHVLTEAQPIAIPSGGNVVVVMPSTAQPAEPKENNWVAGLLGFVVLVGAVIFGLRYAASRGATLPGFLRYLGVELPQDNLNTSPANLRPGAVKQEPLISLSYLPEPGQAAGSKGNNPISTVAGAGPGFVSVSETRPMTPSLVGVRGAMDGAVIPLDGALTIGRELNNALSLSTDGTVSRHHARIEKEGHHWVVTDLHSANGTFVNGQRISQSQRLQEGDEVQFGAARFVFHEGNSNAKGVRG